MNAFKSLFTKYLSHLVGYIVAGATVVSVVDPKGLPPVAVLGISVAGLIAHAAHHGYTAGAGTQVAQAAVDAAIKTLAIVAKPAALLTLMTLATLATVTGSLTACATVGKVDAAITSPAAQPYITAGALVAVGTAEAKGISAVQINTIAKAALAADSGTGATLAAIGAAIDAQVAKLNLPLPDVTAIKVVELEFANYITKQAGANPTVAQTQAAVADVLQAFILATGG